MKNLIEFVRRYAHVFLFVVLEIIALVSVVSSTDYKQWKWNAFSMEAAGPLMKQQSKVRMYLHLRKVNTDLQEANRFLLRQAYNLDASKRTQTDVYIDSLNEPVFEYTIANVLDNSTNLPDNYLILDKGSNDGIRPGLGVLCEQGVVGIVKDVSPHFSIVMSLLHSKFNLSVISGEVVTGVLYWPGKDYRKASVRNVSSLDNVKVGDTLWTHHSLIFPSGYPVGRVSKVKTEVEDGFYALQVRLSAPYDRLVSVWVVKNNFYEELSNLKDSLNFE